MAHILLATSEAAPFAKTGGLADVCGALPGPLAELGQRVTLFLPAYREALQSGQPVERTDLELCIPIGEEIVGGRLLTSRLPATDAPVYLIEQDGYFDRDGLYGEAGADYDDNCQRFAFFCRAVLESIRLLDLDVDVIHCNDWQTGLLPAYLKIEYRHTAGYERIASLLTIHNLAYQGTFPAACMPLTGLDWQYYNWLQMEAYDRLNLLKTGLVFADALTAVSPTYAREIQTAEQGHGLHGVLAERAESLHGILNGVDYNVWNPHCDPRLAVNYDVETWRAGKAACKADLQREMNLPLSPGTPLVGLVGRLAEQKGWGLVCETIDRWSQNDEVQWAILGTGEQRFERRLAEIAAARPDRVAARLDFSDDLAHKIEAGADMFVMASQFEPCGLNQMYSLKYGTVPIVRRTGGLADSVVDCADSTPGKATGFLFDAYTSQALDAALARACRMFRDRPQDWAQVVESGMRQDWSWQTSARKYLELYSALSRLL